MPFFKAEFHTERAIEFKTEFTNTKQDVFEVEFKATITSEISKYEGDYTVTPKVEAQTLETAEKLMKEDVHITAIPTFEVSNDADGQTFYIAKEN